MSLNIKKVLSCLRSSRLQWQDRQDATGMGVGGDVNVLASDS